MELNRRFYGIKVSKCYGKLTSFLWKIKNPKRGIVVCTNAALVQLSTYLFVHGIENFYKYILSQMGRYVVCTRHVPGTYTKKTKL